MLIALAVLLLAGLAAGLTFAFRSPGGGFTQRRRADERELLPVGRLAALPGGLDASRLRNLVPRKRGDSDLSLDKRPAGAGVP